MKGVVKNNITSASNRSLVLTFATKCGLHLAGVSSREPESRSPEVFRRRESREESHHKLSLKLESPPGLAYVTSRYRTTYSVFPPDGRGFKERES